MKAVGHSYPWSAAMRLALLPVVPFDRQPDHFLIVHSCLDTATAQTMRSLARDLQCICLRDEEREDAAAVGG
eukprot:3905414-Ditylum_brightwellii.AAC.1